MNLVQKCNNRRPARMKAIRPHTAPQTQHQIVQQDSKMWPT